LITLRPDVAAVLPGSGDLLERVMNLEGEVYRRTGGRRTSRVVLGGSGFFLKAHSGVGWLEILKNLAQFKVPVLGAKNEWQAVERLNLLGIPTLTLAGYGSRGRNPARMRSFVLTDELTETVSLETYCESRQQARWSAGSKLKLKHALIKEVARLAGTLHRNGVNHRDFYICHILLDLSDGDPSLKREPPRLVLIDLHRAQCRSKTPRRAVVKDLAALAFSVCELGLTRRDLLRFVQGYSGDLRASLSGERRFWHAVQRRAKRLEAKWLRIGDADEH
jgi:heptose I phosphotransferase